MFAVRRAIEANGDSTTSCAPERLLSSALWIKFLRVLARIGFGPRFLLARTSISMQSHSACKTPGHVAATSRCHIQKSVLIRPFEALSLLQRTYLKEFDINNDKDSVK